MSRCLLGAGLLLIIILAGLVPGIEFRRPSLALGRAQFPFLAAEVLVLLFIGERPDLRPLLLAVIVDGAPVLRIDAVQNNVDVPVPGVIVSDEHGLMSVPSHVLQERIGALDHVLRRLACLPCARKATAS